MMLAPVLTPHGLLMLVRSLEAEGEAPALEPEHALRLEKAFARGAGHGLVLLGADEVGTTLSPTLSYWRKLGARYMTALCALPGMGERNKPPVPIPANGELDTMVTAVPPMIGAEYVTTEVLVNLWRGMDLAFDTELAQSKLTVQEFLKRRHPAWNLVGRAHFNLAENRKDEDAPFAFLQRTRPGFQPRPSRSICRSARPCRSTPAREPRAPAIAPDARPAGRRALPLVEGDGRCGRNLSPAALEPTTGGAIPAGRSRARKRRRARAHAGKLAPEPSSSPAGEGNGRRQRPLASRDGCAARLSNGGDARR